MSMRSLLSRIRKKKGVHIMGYLYAYLDDYKGVFGMNFFVI